MSDQTETAAPRPLKVITCYDPTERTPFCGLLVEDTDEARRRHRAWHKHEERKDDGFRRAIKERDDEIGRLRGEVGDLRRDLTGIEIPEPVLGIEINRDGWTDDEDDLDDDPRSTYADDDLAFPSEQARADATAAFARPAQEDDDEDDPANPYFTGIRP